MSTNVKMLCTLAFYDVHKCFILRTLVFRWRLNTL